MRVRERLIRQAREGRKGEGRERVEGSAGGARRAFPARVLQAANGSVILEAPQCAALRDVKAAMKPSNWPDGPQSCACASWPGVACSPAGSVLSLALQGAAGTLPTSLARLSQLSSLSFQEVNLTQSLEWDIPAMPSMARVSLLSAGRPSPLQVSVAAGVPVRGVLLVPVGGGGASARAGGAALPPRCAPCDAHTCRQTGTGLS